MRSEQSEITSPQALLSSYQQVLEQIDAQNKRLSQQQQHRSQFIEHEKQAANHYKQLVQRYADVDKIEDVPQLLTKLGLEKDLHQHFSAYAGNTIMAQADVVEAIAAFGNLDPLIQQSQQLDANCRELKSLHSAVGKRHAEVFREHRNELKTQQQEKELAALAAAQRKRSLRKKLIMTTIFIAGITAFVKFQ